MVELHAPGILVDQHKRGAGHFSRWVIGYAVSRGESLDQTRLAHAQLADQTDDPALLQGGADPPSETKRLGDAVGANNGCVVHNRC